MVGPIVTPDLWNLHADPGALETAAGQWRSLRTGAQDADDTMATAAGRVLVDGVWTGDAADSYGTHRQRLGRSLDELGDLAEKAADGLDAAAYVLQSGQSQLDTQFSALAGAVPATRREQDVVFQPADEAQVTLVEQALTEAKQIREWVDERLRAWAGKLREVEDQLGALGESWAEHTEERDSIRVLDLNVGRGAGNSPGDEEGTEDQELDDIREIILENDADVVALQEVYEGDVDSLFGMETMLEAATGDEWNVHFSAADQKFNAQDGGNVVEEVIQLGTDADDFGNAVLVREGEQIEGSEKIADETLQEPGNLGAFNQGEEGRSIGGARINLAEPDD